MPKIKGFEEALKLLEAMGYEEKARLIEDMSKKDPQMAEQLRSQLIKLEDIQYLTPSQFISFLRDIDLEKFGLALRLVEEKVVEKIMAEVSKGIRLDIED